MGMKMKKSWVLPVLAAGILAAGLAGCEKKDPYGLSAKDPVTITIWHYYNGVQKEGFDQLVQTFNESEGREKGIIVEAYSKGSIDDLSQAVTDSIDKKIGSDPVPDVFAAYADKVYEIDQRDMAVDLSKYLTADEIGEYVDAYIEEGRFDGSEGIKVFPVAKSTEVFAINKTDWDKFAEATGETDAAFSTWEGITRVAEKYYKWTDSLTETPDDGKAFFGRDAFANYIIVGSLQLGHEIFRVEDGFIPAFFHNYSPMMVSSCSFVSSYHCSKLDSSVNCSTASSLDIPCAMRDSTVSLSSLALSAMVAFKMARA